MLEEIYNSIAPLWGKGELTGNAQLGCEIMSHIILWLVFASLIGLVVFLFKMLRGRA